MKARLKRNKLFLNRIRREVFSESAESFRSGENQQIAQRKQYRTLFLSDFHLGARASQAHELLDFLRRTSAEQIFLVGDVFDMWCDLRKTWKPIHTQVLKELVRHSHQGTRIVYIPGNHDPAYRGINKIFGGKFEIADDYVYESHVRRYLVTHGDLADGFCNKWQFFPYALGQIDFALRWVGDKRNRIARGLGFKPSNSFDKLLHNVFRLQEKHSNHIEVLTEEARRRGAQGVICGHFHIPKRTIHKGMIYANCGDWVDHGTLIAETNSGQMVLQSISRASYVKNAVISEAVEVDGFGVA